MYKHSTSSNTIVGVIVGNTVVTTVGSSSDIREKRKEKCRLAKR